MKNRILWIVFFCCLLWVIICGDSAPLLMLPALTWMILFIWVNFGRKIIEIIEEEEVI